MKSAVGLGPALRTAATSAAPLGKWPVPCVLGLLLVAAPFLFPGAKALSVLSQIGITMIFALSFNMLLGQGGLLSFGHSIYSGLAGFCVAHVMNHPALQALPLPVIAMPVVGFFAAAGFAAVFGWMTTRKAGMSFAMITLGLVELVFSCALIFPGFFGGDGGVQTNRVLGHPVLGVTFGPQRQVYFLIAFWVVISTAMVYGFTCTPLGRMLNAVRDNEERAGFIGYDVHMVRYLALVASGGVAGIAGALSAVNYEIVNAESVGIAASGAILLFTFVGGSAHFFGPFLGAVAGVLITVVLASVSQAWPMYLGLFFVGMVIFAPGGLAGILVSTLQLMRRDGAKAVADLFLRRGLPLAASAGAAVVAIEMLYHRMLDDASPTRLRVIGLDLDPTTPLPWIASLAILLLGFVPTLRRRWRPDRPDPGEAGRKRSTNKETE